MVREAGGRVTSLTGEPHSIYDGDILATNGLIHETMTAVLTEGS
jgi:fructose-1,6-bisphosphatase/inositol monophosphatase family enzyme